MVSLRISSTLSAAVVTLHVSEEKKMLERWDLFPCKRTAEENRVWLCLFPDTHTPYLKAHNLLCLEASKFTHDSNSSKRV